MIQAVHEANKLLGLYCLPDLRLVATVTVRQGMFTPPRHMMLPIGPCSTYSLICICLRTYEIDDSLLQGRNKCYGGVSILC
jgi:hypothetical protein